MSIENALVSFWRSKDSTADDQFVGSGCFIAPGVILTAAHLFNGQTFWARPEAKSIPSHPVLEVIRHSQLDIALVLVETPPEKATCMGWSNAQPKAGGAYMHGYFEGRCELNIAMSLLNFDPDERHWVLDHKQPEGHSGSPLCRDNQIVAVLARHYTDANTHRGCAISVHQFRDWLAEQLPATVPTPNPAASAPPTWAEWCERSYKGWQDVFALAPFEMFKHVLKMTPRDLPQRLADSHTTTDPGILGERAVDAVIALVKDCTEAIKHGQVNVTRNTSELARDHFKTAMRHAVRLCQNPEKCASRVHRQDSDLPTLLDSHGDSSAASALFLRGQPENSWRLNSEGSDGYAEIHDKHITSLPVELGEGDDMKRAIAQAAHDSLARPDSRLGQIDESMHRKIRGWAKSEAKEGRARILALARELTPQQRAELESWISSTLGVSVLVPRQGVDSTTTAAFYFAEDEFFPRLCVFLALLEQPEWNPA